MDVLFKTVHGSHLYGLARPDSDDDFYTVVSKVKTNKKKYAKQSIVDNVDSTVVDFGTWLHHCEIGVPQALEAMYSQMPIVDQLDGFRENYYAGTQTWDRYLRTIKSFAFTEDHPYKRRRHALRLALNFAEMRGTGRFNPTMTPEQRSWLGIYANMPAANVYRMALGVAWAD